MTATQRALMRKLGDLIARDAAKLATTDVRDNCKRSQRPRLTFHPVSDIHAGAVAKVQAGLRRRILRAFVGR